MPSSSNLITSNNGGISWTVTTGVAGMRFYAYGFYDGYAGNRTFLTSVDLRLESSLNTTRKIETSARVNAAPELP